jgi:glycosyltransferase involved in cell wall biosynthesis
VIVFCHLLNDQSGSPMVLRSTLEALDAHQNGLLFIGSHGRGVLEGANVTTRRYWYRRSRFRIVTLFNYLLSQVLLYLALSRSRNIPYDATIFVNTLMPFGAMLWGRRTGRKVIVHIHEVSITPNLLRRFLMECASRCADQLLYVSHDHFDRLSIVGPSSKIVFNPVNPVFIEVLMLASLRGYKGIEEFMALARAFRDREDIWFTLVLNAETTEVATLKKRYPNAKNVSLLPRTNNPCDFYARADLLVNLSRTDQWIETFGVTLVEAMTFGLPVIAPPVGGPREIVSNGIEGYCIDSRDSSALQVAVLELADNPCRTMKMSQASLQRAKDFTHDNYAKALHDALNGRGKIIAK